MYDRDALSVELPPPHEDEPAGLRQDILDELSDHLACAYNRELLRGANPAEARRRVLNRFGNPAAVARRLWLDAMKGKIMAQRILIATCFVMVAVCFVMVGFVWSESSRWTQANLGLINQAQRTNQEILEHLEALAKSSRAPAKADEWIPVRFQLTLEKADGPPAVGYMATLRRGSRAAPNEGAIVRRSDAKGQADFGVVRIGDWEYQLEAGGWQATGSLNAVPGTSVHKQLICPKLPPDEASVKIRVAWPAELAGKDLRALVSFRYLPITYEEPIHWFRTGGVQVMCGPQEEMAEVLAINETPSVQTPSKFWRLRKKNEAGGGHPFGPAAIPARGAIATDQVFLDLETTPDMSGPSPIALDAATYRFSQMIVLRPIVPPRAVEAGRGPGPDLGSGDRRFEVLAMLDNAGGGLKVRLLDLLDDGTTSDMGEVRMSGLTPKRSARRHLDRFEAQPGKTAEWTIPVPEELVKLIERKLKGHE